MIQYEYLLRIALAGVCGLIIGYERKSRMKEAGIRTHFVVAIGAALMMVVSKYGFRDVSDWSNLSLDPSRIAAQVVSGVGFLGAGMIFMQKQTVKGLTTAAGMWATAGIGMAIGSGMLVIGIGVSLLIVAGQLVLHSRAGTLSIVRTERIVLRIHDEPGAIALVQQVLLAKQLKVVHFEAHRQEGESAGGVILRMTVRMSRKAELPDLLTLIQDLAFVRSVEVNEHTKNRG